MRRYRLSSRAQADLKNIRAYLVARGGDDLAKHVVGNIREALQFLASNPHAGHLREDLTNKPVKFWSVFSYMIIYDPEQTPLGIARVVHSAQNLGRLLQRLPKS